MRIDLERALADIAAAAQAAATPVPIDRLLGRLHRRRATRRAGSAMAGVGAVGAIAVGGLYLAGRGPTGSDLASMVAADSSDSSDPEDSSDPAPTQPPDPAEAGTFGECGTIITEADPGADGVVGLTVDAPSEVVVAGQPFTITVWQSGTEWDGVVVNGDVETVVARDRVVVGPVGEPSSVTLDSAPPGSRVTLETVSCADGSPLPPGEYELVARQSVTLPIGDGPVDLYRAQAITVVGANPAAD